ncbi:hypothetical protein [Timonella sp. A28]|uniref:hypothetical protein n=1 Tax=Timonella sp. A28 TaxID=3442640 RepID=UPI003EB73998
MKLDFPVRHRQQGGELHIDGKDGLHSTTKGLRDMASTPQSNGSSAGATEHHVHGGNALDTTSAPTASTPAPAPTPVRTQTTAELVSDSVIEWRRALVKLAGDSSLADVSLLGDAVLDLTAAHPSGIAQLFAGRPTRLTNIFREAASLPVARRKTRAVAQRSQDQAERYGIAPTYLAIGIATWTETDTEEVINDVTALARVTGNTALHLQDLAPQIPQQRSRTVKAPVLLRPISISSRGQDTDFELSLEPSAEVNPVLARALRSRGALLDPIALARGAFTGAGFDPSTALDRINSLGEAVLPDFEMVDKLLVGTFVHPGQALVDDLDDFHVGLERHEIIAALAGDEKARELLNVELPEPQVADYDPNLERGVGDLDITGRAALDALATGSHIFVDAPIGADSTGVAAAIVAEAAAIGRNILYVPGHRRAALDLTSRLRSMGLDELLLDVIPSPNWRTIVSRRLLSAMTLETNPLDTRAIADNRLALKETRDHLGKMVDGMHVKRDPWGVSAYDALQALARLTSERPAPSTSVRFDSDTLLRIASGQRDHISEDLTRIAELEGFTIRPAATPWFGANIESDEAAHTALAHVNRLLDTTFATLRANVARVSEETGLATPPTLKQWGEQLEMLAGMREILDQFQPLVFERAADDLVAATATRQWRAERAIEMSGVQRRRLVKRAKDMVRPGVRVTDLHESLVKIQKQREVWAHHCPAGGWPRLPENFAHIESNYYDVLNDVRELAPVLATTPIGGDLEDAPLDALEDRLKRLRDDSAALVTLPERTRLTRGLTRLGLAELLKDFTQRRIDPMLMDAELDLAWWASVFEHLLAADPYLAGIDGNSFETYAQRFRQLDRSHVDSLSLPIKVAAINQTQSVLRNYRDQGEGLFGMLIEERLTSVRSAYEEYGDVMRKLRPCTVATPTMVPHLLPARRTVDLVVLDAVQHLPVESLLSAIARGRQVVVIGDPRCAAGGAISQLADILPRVSLSGDALRRDSGLTRFLMKHGYSDVLAPIPLPAATSFVRLEQVYGTGMPDPETGAVLSTDAEIDKVVDLAISHALDHPEESLAIIAGSQLHSDRIREAIVAQVRENHALVAFFDPRRIEPVVISDVRGVAGLNRDAVIFSLGFGRTPHGRTLHRFGEISEPHGGALLLNALGVTRRRLTVVACFNADDLDVQRLRSPGARMLGAMLDFAAGGEGDPIPAPEHREPSDAARSLVSMLTSGIRTVDPAHTTSAVAHVETRENESVAVESATAAPDAAQDTAAMEPVDSSDETEQAHNDTDTPQDVTEETPDGAAEAERTDIAATDETVDDGNTDLSVASSTEPDRLLIDLADRLWKFGLSVETNYGFDGSERIPLVAGHPDFPGEYFVAVLTDDLAYVEQPSLRARDRHRAERLEALGWSVVTLWSVALFLDPEAQANKVREAVFRVEAHRRARDIRATGALPVIPSDATFSVLEAERTASDTLLSDAVSAATQQSVEPEDSSLQARRGERPDVPFGLPMSAYGDDQLDELALWIISDGITRDEEEIAAIMRDELGIRRRSHRVDSAISYAIRRVYS